MRIGRSRRVAGKEDARPGTPVDSCLSSRCSVESSGAHHEQTTMCDGQDVKNEGPLSIRYGPRRLGHEARVDYSGRGLCKGLEWRSQKRGWLEGGVVKRTMKKYPS